MTTAQLLLKRSNPNQLSARLAMKLLAVIVALMLVISMFLCGITTAFAGTLNPIPNVMVKGENVKLGDVFDGVTQHADFVLAPSPRPGEELVWNAPTLLRIATAFNLPWRPEDDSEIRIRRAAALIDADTMRAVVRDHLASLNGDDTYDVRFNSAVPEVTVQTSGSPKVELSDFNMQSVGGTFSAILKISGDSGAPQLVNLRGVADRMVRLPVLNADFRAGQIITAQDIGWTTQRAVLAKTDVIRDANAVIGTTPRHVIGRGEILRADSLKEPQMIKRGDFVTMIYKTGGMYLTAKGRALEDGAYNGMIKVTNTSSSRQLQAKVTGAREVTID